MKWIALFLIASVATAATCAFFKPDKEADLGECHRYPPTVLPEDNGGVSFSFALTASDEWCGEYIRRVN
jgi:hypothetical protein